MIPLEGDANDVDLKKEKKEQKKTPKQWSSITVHCKNSHFLAYSGAAAAADPPPPAPK